jgi:hypothetical protein
LPGRIGRKTGKEGVSGSQAEARKPQGGNSIIYHFSNIFRKSVYL